MPDIPQPAGALSLTGQFVRVGFTGPETGTVAITGRVVALAVGLSLGVGSLGFAGQFVRAGFIGPETGAVALSGHAPTLAVASTGPVIAVPVGRLEFQGYYVGIAFLSPSTGQLTLTGYAPTLEAAAGLMIPAGSLALTGRTPTPSLAFSLSIPVGGLRHTGYAPYPGITIPWPGSVPVDSITTQDIIDLFGGGEIGVIYDVQDITSMFQDSAGTVPAAVDSPVGRINDLSGGNRHAVQATAGRRPMLRHSTVRGYYLQSDGVDDCLLSDFTITMPLTRVSMLEQLSWDNINFMYRSSNGHGRLQQNPATPSLQIASGAGGPNSDRLRLNTPGLVTEFFDGANSTIAINQDTPTTGDAGTSAPDGISIFDNPGGGLAAEARLYRVVMIDRALTATELEDVQAWASAHWTRVVVIDGDSNSWNDTVYGRQFIPNAVPPAFVQVIAIPGTGFHSSTNDIATNAARIANTVARIPDNKRGRQYVYLAWCSNQWPGGGYLGGPVLTAEESAATYATFLQARKADGYDKVGIGTIIERTDNDNTVARLAYNAIIAAPGWIEANGIDFLVDFGAEPTMGAVGVSTNTTYFLGDLTHPNQTGQALLEVVFRAAINGLAMASTLAGAGSLEFTGQSVTLALGQSVPVGALTLTGRTPAVMVAQTLSIPAGSLRSTGYASTLLGAGTISPSAGAVTFTGHVLTLGGTQTLALPAGSLRFTGYATTLVGAGTISPSAGVLTFTGHALTLGGTQSIAIPAGSLVYQGLVPSPLGAGTISPAAGVLRFTGYAPAVLFGIALTPSAGQLTYTGSVLTVVAASGDVVRTIPAGQLVFAGSAGVVNPFAPTASVVIRVRA